MIKIGIKPFNEQKIIADLIKKRLEYDCEIVVSEPIPQGNFNNLINGKVNLTIDYLGTLYNSVFNLEEILPWDKDLMLNRVKRLLEEKNIEILNFLGFSNDFVFVSKNYYVENLESLKNISNNLIFGCPKPFIERKDGLPLLKKYYNLNFREVIPISVDKIYEALIEDKVQIITGFKTDAKIEKYSLYIINDNKKIMPPYDALILGKNLNEEIKEKLKDFKINEKEMRHLNLLFELGELKIG
ncbi:MAG: osmoprotection protein (proX) [Caldisericia bacterium]|nr:osmoprotection protein (proX) [Caldisericia bacterium]